MMIYEWNMKWYNTTSLYSLDEWIIKSIVDINNNLAIPTMKCDLHGDIITVCGDSPHVQCVYSHEITIPYPLFLLKGQFTNPSAVFLLSEFVPHYHLLYSVLGYHQCPYVSWCFESIWQSIVIIMSGKMDKNILNTAASSYASSAVLIPSFAKCNPISCVPMNWTFLTVHFPERNPPKKQKLLTSDSKIVKNWNYLLGDFYIWYLKPLGFL